MLRSSSECLITLGTSDKVSSVGTQSFTDLISFTALKYLGADVDPPVPWQRVIGSSGTISRRGQDGAQRQREALEAEDVEVREGRTGDLLVDFTTYGWFPTREEIADE